MNDLFEYMPLACSIGSKIFAVHAGIGSRINRLSDIDSIKRPVVVPDDVSTQEQQIIMDLLWSDPTDHEEELGVVANLERDPTQVWNIVKYGPDRIDKFLKTNFHSVILRSHGIAQQGYEKFADGNLITINSFTNYCNWLNNDACFFVV